MRFLQLVTARGPAAVRNPEAAKTIREAIAAGRILATGGLGKRTTAAARVSKRGAIANARATLDFLGDADVEVIQVTELHPPADASPSVHYLEIVTPEPERVRDAYAAMQGLRFEQSVALPPTELAGHGRIAIYVLGGVEHGLWEL